MQAIDVQDDIKNVLFSKEEINAKVAELAALQDRIDALDADVRRLRAEAEAARSAASAELRRVIGARSL